MPMNDAQLIDHYGGPARLAKVLGWHESRAIQRIHNWRARGIPAAVKLRYPEVFLTMPVPAPAAEKACAETGREVADA